MTHFTYTPEERRAHVDVVAALLDAKAPGWFNRIDLATLDLDDCNCCVFGQVFRGQTPGLVGYTVGHDVLGLDYNDMHWVLPDVPASVVASADIYGRHWLSAIISRLEASFVF